METGSEFGSWYFGDGICIDNPRNESIEYYQQNNQYQGSKNLAAKSFTISRLKGSYHIVE